MKWFINMLESLWLFCSNLSDYFVNNCLPLSNYIASACYHHSQPFHSSPLFPTSITQSISPRYCEWNTQAHPELPTEDITSWFISHSTVEGMWWCICSTGLQTRQSVVHGRYVPRYFQNRSNHFIIEKTWSWHKRLPTNCQSQYHQQNSRTSG